MRRAAAALLVVVAAGCATARRPVTSPAPAAPSPTPAAPTATPAPRPAPPPLPPPAGDLAPPLVRVLLDRAAAVRLPQPGRAYRVRGERLATRIVGPVTVTAPRATAWQVGAWRDAATAAVVARRLAAALPGRATVWREPAPGGLTRVRVRWVRQPADPAAALAGLGFPEAAPVALPLLHLEGADGTLEAGGEVVLEPEGDWPVAVGRRRYRGRLRLRAVGGEVQVVNELDLERYLYGVVPREMGPAAFPELEALKAQAVAARTYAVAHLGDHDAEGYDLCATPACQVYGGFDAEHPLTNRAVDGTAGVIAVHGGEPIDAMYTSTCGGHTEDAGELFPERAAPYLVGVACAWERPLSLVGEGGADGVWRDGLSFRAELARRVLGLGEGAGAGEIVAALAAACGRPAPAAGAGEEAFAAAALEACGLEEAAALEGADGALANLLRLADRQRVALPPPLPGREAAWRLAAAGAVLELSGVVVRDAGEAVPRPDGAGIYPARATASEPLPSPVPLWERWDAAVREVARAEVLPGTRLERWRAGDEVVALVVVRSGGDGTADRRSRWTWWAREVPWEELARRLGIPDLESVEVTRRSPTGRAVGLRATGRSGTVREWSGFDVRQALGLPETWFAMTVLERGGRRVARFLGRGWGHGVGLCQNGAYGLARAGMTYDRILRHYYPGIELVTWPAEAAAAGR